MTYCFTHVGKWCIRYARSCLMKKDVICANGPSQLPTTFDGICHSVSFPV